MKKNTRANRGPKRRDFAPRITAHSNRPDRRCWIVPDRVAPPITLPQITMDTVSDEDVGLPFDPAAQGRAESYIKAALAYRQREGDLGRQLARAVPENAPVLHVELPDDSLAITAPNDRLSPIDAAILAELRRLTCGGVANSSVTEGVQPFAAGAGADRIFGGTPPNSEGNKAQLARRSG